MKTLTDLFAVAAEAVQENGEGYRTWFIDYSGHVNTMSIKFYFTGWKPQDSPKEEIRQELSEDGIQVLYYFIKTRLGKNQ